MYFWQLGKLNSYKLRMIFLPGLTLEERFSSLIKKFSSASLTRL